MNNWPKCESVFYHAFDSLYDDMGAGWVAKGSELAEGREEGDGRNELCPSELVDFERAQDLLHALPSF